MPSGDSVLLNRRCMSMRAAGVVGGAGAVFKMWNGDESGKTEQRSRASTASAFTAKMAAMSGVERARGRGPVGSGCSVF
jgi:hypothetical protein